MAKKHKLPVAVNSDAHYCETVGEASNAINVIRSVGITQDQIINTSADGVLAYLKRLKRRLQAITAVN